MGAEKVLGWTAEIVRHPPKLAPEEVMRAWVSEFNKEGVPIDGKKGASTYWLMQKPQLRS